MVGLVLSMPEVSSLIPGGEAVAHTPFETQAAIAVSAWGTASYLGKGEGRPRKSLLGP